MSVVLPPPVSPGPGSSWALWARALGFRRGFLLITPLPVILGTLSVALAGEPVPLPTMFGVLVGAWLLHGGTNLANDYWDHLSGTDDQNLHPTPFSGGTRVIQEGLISPPTMLAVSLGLFLAGLLVFAGLAQVADCPSLMGMALLGAACGYFYTAPPVRLAHRGLGELAVGLNFGPFLAIAASLAAAGRVLPSALLGGFLIFPHSVAVLLVMEVPDTPADRSVGKRHLLVRFGEARGLALARVLLRSVHPLMLVGIVTGILPWTASLALGSVPAVESACRELERGWCEVQERPEDTPGRYDPFLSACKATLRAKFLTGWLLAIGLTIGLVLP